MSPKRLENLKIVVVDDQEDARTAVGRYLSSLGADVHTVDRAGQCHFGAGGDGLAFGKTGAAGEGQTG